MKTVEEKAEKCYRFAVCLLKLTVHLQRTQQYNEHGKRIDNDSGCMAT